MARVNISIPDELYGRLEDVRASLNISAVCQEALQRELTRRQPIPEDVELTDEIIERLRSEKETYERESREMGFKVGTEWARRAKFPALRRWGKYKLSPSQDLGEVETPPVETIQWFFEAGEWVEGKAAIDRYVRSYPELAHVNVTSDYDPRSGQELSGFEYGDKKSFNEGFLQAVKRFWEQVKERI